MLVGARALPLFRLGGAGLLRPQETPRSPRALVIPAVYEGEGDDAKQSTGLVEALTSTEVPNAGPSIAR